MNVITRVELELAYYDAAVQHGSHFMTGTLREIYEEGSRIFENLLKTMIGETFFGEKRRHPDQNTVRISENTEKSP